MAWAHLQAHIFKKKENAICIVSKVKLDKDPPGLDPTTRLRAANLCVSPAISWPESNRAVCGWSTVAARSLQSDSGWREAVGC